MRACDRACAGLPRVVRQDEERDVGVRGERIAEEEHQWADGHTWLAELGVFDADDLGAASGQAQGKNAEGGQRTGC